MLTLEHRLWKACDNLRANSSLKESEFCMPVLGIIFLKYMDARYKKAKKKINEEYYQREGIILPEEEDDYKRLGVIMLPEGAQYNWILSLPEDISSKELKDVNGQPLNSLGEVLDNAMTLIATKTEKLRGILFGEYNRIPDKILKGLLEIFDHEDITWEDDKLGSIYEYFLEQFASYVKGEEGIFFTPPSLVNIIVNILEPTQGTVLDPACGSGGMFIAIKQYMDKHNLNCNEHITFWGHEKVEHNARLCLMNIFIHHLGSGKIAGGDDANSYYNDHWGLNGKCDYVLANPPFNIVGVNAEAAEAAGRLPFGLPQVSKLEIKNANFLWISYFYSYLNSTGKAGFVMPSITMSGTVDKEIRSKVVETKHIDLLINVAPKFFKSKFKGDCCLWFFNKQKPQEYENKVLFIDASNYYVPVDAGHNTWNEWQSKNLISTVQLYRGQVEKYRELISEYKEKLRNYADKFSVLVEGDDYLKAFKDKKEQLIKDSEFELSSITNRKEKMKLKQEWEEKHNSFDNAITVAKEFHWIYSKFGEGEYKDIPGFCKVAEIEEIKENDYSLVPGVYVGLEEEELEDQETFFKRMEVMHQELDDLEKEAIELMSRIRKNKSLWMKSS
ncbi:type I restriction-modification system subunit M [Mycoplasma suis]|uniref:site-specific DNA-methyltransferase (adenine-specific) n=1 Tax=Mycoplasma suis (strain Illinois) TaxID=768700 RepID=F0QS50_MYCSL|nr:type I restriction-modification system subunit M [Mycoplasma suis]ADX98320.1 type I restriction-modification system, N-6 DNA Methylase family protein [Mycoplasma suis str. Illinois]